MWIVSLCASVVACLWLVWNSVFGSPDIYHAGNLSTPHRMFEHRCEACHAPFRGPLERLLLQGVGNDATPTSAPDKKCLECHAGEGHFFADKADTSAKDGDSASSQKTLAAHDHHCAECHREHGGEQDLSRISNAFCIECHGQLHEYSNESKKIRNLTFQDGGKKNISTFADHPEFALHTLQGAAGDAALPKLHGASSVVEFFQRTGEQQPRWQDKARIRFNHSKHLNTKDPRGLPDARGEYHNLRDNCSACHRPDAERLGMEPINFEMHCSSCHPLVFDADQVRRKDGTLFRIDWDSTDSGGARLRNVLNPEEQYDIEEFRKEDSPFDLLVAPHQSPEEVRGFLTDLYTLNLIREARGASADIRPNNVVRELPGKSVPSGADPAAAREKLDSVEQQIHQAESLVRAESFGKVGQPDLPNLFRSLNWLQGSGGCNFCHEGSNSADQDWTVRKPDIPTKWMKHAKFNHDSHRALNCVQCHSSLEKSGDMVIGENNVPDIYQSTSTGDILMPQVALCKTCHNESGVEGSNNNGAGSDCLECHIYHKRDFEDHKRDLKTHGGMDLKKFLGMDAGPKSGE
jgi:hypothetical protein